MINNKNYNYKKERISICDSDENTPSGGGQSLHGMTLFGIIFSRASQDESINKINEENKKIENLQSIIKSFILKCNNFHIKIMIIFKEKMNFIHKK